MKTATFEMPFDKLASSISVGDSYMDANDFKTVTITDINTDLIEFHGDVQGLAHRNVFKKNFSLMLQTVG